MENNEMLTVPYVVHRDAIAHDRWLIKRLTIVIIVVVALMFISNALWLYFWNQYEYTTEEAVVDSIGSGIANFTGGDGGVVYGASDSPQNNPDEGQPEQ
jgi:hypothetical protein